MPKYGITELLEWLLSIVRHCVMPFKDCFVRLAFIRQFTVQILTVYIRKWEQQGSPVGIEPGASLIKQT